MSQQGVRIEALAMSDVVGVMNNGRFEQVSNPRQSYDELPRGHEGRARRSSTRLSSSRLR